ncbi:BTAD domain-containing putative transcriptional regulator [Amycolatopsis sp. YIM 10]|uniref:AfsR/SARP family transcriptional regulator n=1 Tax=Amycolatopsis sp. YIM 10 TaxID=2653857 RepID=UPI00128FD776|nr:BTAD domain-containing putative transcriptional regulator [Amycolatopsis sp. YIM 10]QFU92563.1 Regulatory protein AfsR [Amycolatopsis sp. YIM 10]
MEFRILGPLVAEHAGLACSLGGARQRAVLAALLLRANDVASVDYLADMAWETAPASPVSNVRTYIAGLRQCLPDGADRILTRERGYLLVVNEGELDLAAFQRHHLAGDTARQAGQLERAAEEYQCALHLWRGQPLENVTGSSAMAADVTRLNELRLSVVERHIEVRLLLGQHADLVGELRSLVTEYPLREQLWVYLLRALHSSGRRADALQAYQQVRRLLDTELAFKPGQALREQHATILSDDTVQVGVRQPRQLPTPVQPYVGRAAELTEAAALLRTQAVVTVSGPPGVGKTAFAVQAGHRMITEFPDGQLWVNLRGADPEPQDPAAVLARFLRDLGVAGTEVPHGIRERSALFRDYLAERRVLLVLDNANNEEQVRPLLPDRPGCAALVTSRSRLTGLDTTARIRLGALGPATGVRLLDHPAGTPDQDRDALMRVAQLCGGLPLALRIVGTKLRSLPHLSIASMERRLAQERHRLDEIVSGDRELRASFHLSYTALPAAGQRAFRLLSLIPGPNFPAWAAGAVCDSDLRTAEHLLDHLVEANLLECSWTGGRVRYHFHDLLRLFARERAAADDTPDERAEAFRRVSAAYLYVAHHADARLEFGGMSRDKPPTADLGAPDLLNELTADAPGWFDEELPVLLAMQEHAAHTGQNELVCQLTGFLVAYLELRSQWDHLQRVSDLSRVAAQRIGDPYWIASSFFASGLAARERRDLELCERLFADCVKLLPMADDARLDILVRLAVGVGLRLQGKLTAARECFSDCLTRLASLDLPAWHAYTLRELGVLDRYTGDWVSAERHLRVAVDIFEQLGDHRWHAASMRELGIVLRELGDLPAAATLLWNSCAKFAELGDRRREAGAWRSLALLHLRSGDGDTALSHATRSRDLYTQTLDRVGKACTEIVLGEIHIHRGSYTIAQELLRTGLAVVKAHHNNRWTTRARLALERVASMPPSMPGAH